MRFSLLAILLIVFALSQRNVLALSSRELDAATSATNRNGMSPDKATDWTSQTNPTYSPSRKPATFSRKAPTPSRKAATPSRRVPSPSRRVGSPSSRPIPSTSRRLNTLTRTAVRKVTLIPSQRPLSARTQTHRATPTRTRGTTPKPTPGIVIEKECNHLTFDFSSAFSDGRDRPWIATLNVSTSAGFFFSVQKFLRLRYDNSIGAYVPPQSLVRWTITACPRCDSGVSCQCRLLGSSVILTSACPVLPVHVTRTCSSVTFDVSDVFYPQDFVYLDEEHIFDNAFAYSTVRLVISDNKGWIETLDTHFDSYYSWNHLIRARVFQSSTVTWRLSACRSLRKRNITSCEDPVYLGSGSFNTTACRGVPVGTQVSVVESCGKLTASLSQYLMDSDIHTVWVESVSSGVLRKQYALLVSPVSNQFVFNPAILTTGFSNGAQWILKGTYRSSQSAVQLARGVLRAVCQTPSVPIVSSYFLTVTYSTCDSISWHFGCDPIYSEYNTIPYIWIQKEYQSFYSGADWVSGIRLLEAGTYTIGFHCGYPEGEPDDYEETVSIPACQT